MKRLEGKVCIVTGGGHGIGAEYCRGLAQEGAMVAVADIDSSAADIIARDIANAGGAALPIKCDVSNEGETLYMAKKTFEKFGRIDVLINNAAYFATIPISRLPFDQLSIQEWDRVFEVNTKGVFLCCRAVFPQMKKQKSGKIINISSNSIFHGKGYRIHYVASKTAVIGFTRTLARELGEYGITVNCVSPGGTLSESPDNVEARKMRESIIKDRCIQRLQWPKDLLGTIIFLSSEDSDFVTGQNLIVDGGMMFQ